MKRRVSDIVDIGMGVVACIVLVVIIATKILFIPAILYVIFHFAMKYW